MHFDKMTVSGAVEEWVERGVHGSVGSLVRAAIKLELARLRAAYPKAKEERQDPFHAALERRTG